MFDNSILVELQDVGDISVDIGDVKTVVVPEKKVPQAIPRITVDENGLITATSNQESGSVDGGIEKSTYQLAVENGKTVYPSENQQIIVKKNTYSLGDIILEKVSSEEKTVDVTDDGNYEISPSYGKLLSKAFVNVDTSQKRKEAFEAGKKAEYDAFWDVCQNYGNRTDYSNAFGGQGWRPDNFKPKYDIRPTNAYMMFRAFGFADDYSYKDFAKHLEDLGVVLDFSNCSNMQYAFQIASMSRLGKIDLSNCTSTSNLFAYSTIYEIDEIVFSENTQIDGIFIECGELKNVEFSGVIASNGLNLQWSKKLDKASLSSVVNALSTNTSGLTATLSKVAVDKAFEETAYDGHTSAEWLALVATRSNWNIALA